MDNMNITAISKEQAAKDKSNILKTRLLSLERHEDWPAFVEFLANIEKAVLVRAAATDNGNLDTKTIGILRGISYAKCPSKFVDLK